MYLILAHFGGAQHDSQGHLILGMQIGSTLIFQQYLSTSSLSTDSLQMCLQRGHGTSWQSPAHAARLPVSRQAKASATTTRWVVGIPILLKQDRPRQPLIAR
jgi:hypothetical protein